MTNDLWNMGGDVGSGMFRVYVVRDCVARHCMTYSRPLARGVGQRPGVPDAVWDYNEGVEGEKWNSDNV